ncbi:hypothetical protein FP76_gp075 [Bacillus phage Evoli]|uniref:Uncharacterized protein n=1 Tax=Bacillus phage Evoli TaxID=1486658 RepID=A0A024AZM4_9CAUD|nr:hypothetical protein FP76_gp075 [Bacillus phage Evoli]AHZ09799.1 hypothetical protein [Bacillus phage Evoli]ASR79751.1 hypothetical protein JANET_73 [Bacillus phage Janet]
MDTAGGTSYNSIITKSDTRILVIIKIFKIF